MTPAGDYSSDWSEYRNRRRLAQAGIGFLFVGSAVSLVLLDSAPRAWRDDVWFFPAILIPLVSPGVVFLERLKRWPCPRCRNRFCWRPATPGIWTTRCLHCGLEYKGVQEPAP